MKDLLAQIIPSETAIGPPTATARRLVRASVSPNTRRAYAGALRRLDAWLEGRRLDDAALAAYLGALHDAGRAPASAALVVAAASFRARIAGTTPPAQATTARVLAGYRRTTAERGRGQARPFTAEDLAAVLATCHLPRRRGRGIESDQVAAARGRLDAVIAGLLFMGGLRRSEVAALRWADVADARTPLAVTASSLPSAAARRTRRARPTRLAHLLDLRTVLDGAFTAAGRAAPIWTDASPRAGTTPIRAGHLMELRAAVVALE